jgi:regulator of protease activity HflC (stomatin/prohibitin superfamily)
MGFWKIAFLVKLGMILVAGLVALGLWGCPTYNVWQKELAGKAELKQAEWNRQIKIQEANARMESAKLLAKAEVERAKGVAEANKLIGESLKGNEVYLRYLWVQGLQDGRSEVIYVPTEANLPILEATRGLKK